MWSYGTVANWLFNTAPVSDFAPCDLESLRRPDDVCPKRACRLPPPAYLYICIRREGVVRQFTMNIDDSLLQAAKLYAVTTGRTVSDIVRDLLAREVGWSGSGPLAPLDDVRAAPVLEAYSTGRISRRQAMQA